MAAHWLTVGILLKIEHHKLEIVKKDYHDQSMECLREMLTTWLRGTDHASPVALVRALRSAGMTVLAKKVAIKHGEQD